MSNQKQTFGLCFGVILLLPWLGGSPAIGQQPASPGFQQQIRRGFDRVKDQIAEKFGRPASVGRPAGVHAQHDRPPHNRSLQHHPPHHQFGRHSQPLPPQRLPVQASSPPGFEQRQYHTADEQRGYYDQETHPAAYWQQPATDPNTLRTEPAMPGPRLQGSSLRDHLGKRSGSIRRSEIPANRCPVTTPLELEMQLESCPPPIPRAGPANSMRITHARSNLARCKPNRPRWIITTSDATTIFPIASRQQNALSFSKMNWLGARKTEKLWKPVFNLSRPNSNNEILKSNSSAIRSPRHPSNYRLRPVFINNSTSELRQSLPSETWKRRHPTNCWMSCDGN